MVGKYYIISKYIQRRGVVESIFQCVSTESQGSAEREDVCIKLGARKMTRYIGVRPEGVCTRG